MQIERSTLDIKARIAIKKEEKRLRMRKLRDDAYRRLEQQKQMQADVQDVDFSE